MEDNIGAKMRARALRLRSRLAEAPKELEGLLSKMDVETRGEMMKGGEEMCLSLVRDIEEFVSELTRLGAPPEDIASWNQPMQAMLGWAQVLGENRKNLTLMDGALDVTYPPDVLDLMAEVSFITAYFSQQQQVAMSDDAHDLEEMLSEREITREEWEDEMSRLAGRLENIARELVLMASASEGEPWAPYVEVMGIEVLDMRKIMNGISSKQEVN